MKTNRFLYTPTEWMYTALYCLWKEPGGGCSATLE